MKTTLVLTAALALAGTGLFLAPSASACTDRLDCQGPPGFGHCYVTYENSDDLLATLVSPAPDLPNERVPSGYECVW